MAGKPQKFHGMESNNNSNQMERGYSNNIQPNGQQYGTNSYGNQSSYQNYPGDASGFDGVYQGQPPQGYQQQQQLYNQQPSFQGQGVQNYNYPPPGPPKYYYDQPSSFPVEWILFIVGWIFPILWVVGSFLPLCRRPRFDNKCQKGGWIACLTASCIVIAIIIVAVSVSAAAVNRAHNYNYSSSSSYSNAYSS